MAGLYIRWRSRSGSTGLGQAGSGPPLAAVVTDRASAATIIHPRTCELEHAMRRGSAWNDDRIGAVRPTVRRRADERMRGSGRWGKSRILSYTQTTCLTHPHHPTLARDMHNAIPAPCPILAQLSSGHYGTLCHPDTIVKSRSNTANWSKLPLPKLERGPTFC